MTTTRQALDEMTEGQLLRERAAAERAFADATLHTRLPVAQQGDQRPQAEAARQVMAEQAAERWLACQQRLAELGQFPYNNKQVNPEHRPGSAERLLAT